MRILHPSYLFLLLVLIPLLFIGWVNFKRSYHFLKFGNHYQEKQKTLDAFLIKKILSFFSLFFSLIFLILALSGFSKREVVIKEIHSELDIVFLLDISNSMLTQDHLGNTRLEESKKLISQLTNRFQRKSYYFSLIGFKGTAETFLPLSNNFYFLDNFLKEVSPWMINTRGSNLFAGIKEAYKHFDNSERQKVIIILTDGGDWSDYDTNFLKDLILEDINLIVLGFGAPVGISFSDSGGNLVVDTKGREILSKQESEYLKRLAKDSDGTYMNVYNQGITSVVNEIEESLFSLGLNNKGTKIVSLYRWFLVTSFILFLFSLGIIKVSGRGTL